MADTAETEALITEARTAVRLAEKAQKPYEAAPHCNVAFTEYEAALVVAIQAWRAVRASRKKN